MLPKFINLFKKIEMNFKSISILAILINFRILHPNYWQRAYFTTLHNYAAKLGEVAEKKVLTLNTDTIQKEEKFDGFYGVCTNLEDNAEEIIKVNQRRWEIEESFRIMKSEFKARPVYLSRDDRITAHFTTCFLSLVILRFLEKKAWWKIYKFKDYWLFKKYEFV